MSAAVDSHGIVGGGDLTVQPPPNEEWMHKHTFVAASVTTKVTDGSDSEDVEAGEVLKEFPIDDSVYLKLENSACATTVAFYHAVTL